MSVKLAVSVMSAAAVWGVAAAEIQWSDDVKTYELGAEDELALPESATITADYVFSGNGVIRKSGGTLTLQYQPLASGFPFMDFTGKVIVENAVLAGELGIHGENGQPAGGFNLESTLELRNSVLDPVARGSNNTSLPNLIVSPGANGEGSRIVNIVSRGSGSHGNNLRIPGNISGSGDLTIEQWDRNASLSGDNSGYSGQMHIIGREGKFGNQFWFSTASSGSAAASFVHDRPGRLYIGAATGETISLGALNLGPNSLGVDMEKSGAIVEIGACSRTNSSISVQFHTNPLTLRKVGAETSLTLSDAAAFRDGSILEVAAGVVHATAANLSNVVVRLTSGTVLNLGESVTASVNADGNVELSGSGEVRVGKFEAEGMGHVVVGDNVTLLLGCSQTIARNGFVAGGTNSGLGFCGGRMDFAVSGDNDQFSIAGFSKLTLAGTAIYLGGYNNVTLAMPLDIVSGTSNIVSSTKANTNIQNLSGGGYLELYTDNERGPTLNGDNSRFSGTLKIWSKKWNRYPPTGWYGNATGSANAVWLLPQDWYVNREGEMSYTFFNQDVNGDPLKFGAFVQTAPNARLRAGSTKQYRHGMKIEIGARGDVDSEIQGRIVVSRVNLRKVGAGSCLTLGTNFAMVAESSLEIAEGKLGFALPETEEIPAVSLLPYSVSFGEQVNTIRVSMTAEQLSALEIGRNYEVAKLPSNPGFLPQTELWVDGAAAVRPDGVAWGLEYWKVKFVNRPATDTSAAYTAAVLSYRPPRGMLLILR